MAQEPHFPAARRPTLAITDVGGQRAVLTFAGELDTGRLQELEEQLHDPRLREAREWVLEMADLTRLDLACAYALLRAATTRPQIASLTVRHARRPVQRTLRHVGIEQLGTIDE